MCRSLFLLQSQSFIHFENAKMTIFSKTFRRNMIYVIENDDCRFHEIANFEKIVCAKRRYSNQFVNEIIRDQMYFRFD